MPEAAGGQFGLAGDGPQPGAGPMLLAAAVAEVPGFDLVGDCVEDAALLLGAQKGAGAVGAFGLDPVDRRLALVHAEEVELGAGDERVSAGRSVGGVEEVVPLLARVQLAGVHLEPPAARAEHGVGLEGLGDGEVLGAAQLGNDVGVAAVGADPVGRQIDGPGVEAVQLGPLGAVERRPDALGPATPFEDDEGVFVASMDVLEEAGVVVEGGGGLEVAAVEEEPADAGGGEIAPEAGVDEERGPALGGAEPIGELEGVLVNPNFESLA